MNRFSLPSWLIWIILFCSSFSYAHEQKVALTDVFYNERTGNLEVAHRFRVHDAEHTLYKATKSNADLTKSSKAREAFANYVVARFKLTRADKKEIKLSLVGQELDRGYLWVYQETPIPDPVDVSFFISNTILHDVVKKQVNTVNVRYRSHVSSYVFEENAGRKLYTRPGGSATDSLRMEDKK